MNQGIAHPLAKCWAQLEAANLMVMKAATLFDRGLECGVEANAGKYLAGESAFEACHTAMLTLGGMGYAQEFHVERLLREVLIPRTAPVSPHMILNFLAEKVLGLPRSYGRKLYVTPRVAMLGIHLWGSVSHRDVRVR